MALFGLWVHSPINCVQYDVANRVGIPSLGAIINVTSTTKIGEKTAFRAFFAYFLLLLKPASSKSSSPATTFFFFGLTGSLAAATGAVFGALGSNPARDEKHSVGSVQVGCLAVTWSRRVGGLTLTMNVVLQRVHMNAELSLAAFADAAFLSSSVLPTFF